MRWRSRPPVDRMADPTPLPGEDDVELRHTWPTPFGITADEWATALGTTPETGYCTRTEAHEPHRFWSPMGRLGALDCPGLATGPADPPAADYTIEVVVSRGGRQLASTTATGTFALTREAVDVVLDGLAEEIRRGRQ